ncbi:MAG: hypothetical protein KUG65_07450, partial [Sphingomonadaceae bacterium]|nr:hypothetical protein [Sphingomonadaceae bacterium]
MTVYPIALALLVFAALLSLRTGPIAAGGLLLPFGATAAMTVGSASLLVADIYFIAVGALMLIFGVILKGRAVVPKTFILPLVIAGFAILSALTLPFIFEGTPIYPTSFLSGRVTRHYYLVPLKFSSGNISQTI